jgi:hypothetical protein
MTTESIETIEIGGTLSADLVHELLAQLEGDGVDVGSIDIVSGQKLKVSVPYDDLPYGFADGATTEFCVRAGLTFRQEEVYYGGDIVNVTVWEPGMDRPDSYQYLCESIVMPTGANTLERVERVRHLDRLAVPPLTFVEPAVGFV